MNKLEQASNPNTPIKTLEKLATDKNSYVRCRVAENPNAPHYIKKVIKIHRLLCQFSNWHSNQSFSSNQV
jgi:hypothetical protein